MIKQVLFTAHVFTFSSIVFGQQVFENAKSEKVNLIKDTNGNKVNTDLSKHTWEIPFSNLEIPKKDSNETVIVHEGYSLLYNELHEQASWVAYHLTKEETIKIYDRTNKFISDPKIITGSANGKDYKGSGYDRGHLAPAADMGWSPIAMAESFFYSNMSPQTPSFNRGIWKKLEELTRDWASEYNAVYIVTGPILGPDLKSIGPNKVSVPRYYYKVILDVSEPIIKGIGFILPNTGSAESLQQFALPIDSVESITGLDFFPLLENDTENQVEETLCIECWSW